jgi:hypothetical protein
MIFKVGTELSDHQRKTLLVLGDGRPRPALAVVRAGVAHQDCDCLGELLARGWIATAVHARYGSVWRITPAGLLALKKTVS